MNKTIYEPREGLLEKIISRIRHEERVLAVRNKIIIFSAMLLFSSMSLIYVSRMLASDFSSSGFGHFFSLLFSDFSAISLYWQSFIFALLEALPAASLALFLVLLLLFLQSFKSLFINIKVIKNNKPLIN